VKRLLSLLFFLAALIGTAGTVHYWSFEDDSLAPSGVFGTFEQGTKPVYADVVSGKEIWDGGTYTQIQTDNKRSVYFAPTPVTNLSPLGGEIAFPGGDRSFQQPTMTVECFVRVEEQAKRFALLVSKRRSNGSTWSLALSPEGVVTGRFDTQTGDSRIGFNRTVSSGVAVNDGEWHHVALAYDHATQTGSLFVDYELKKTVTTTGPLVYDDAVLTIGRGLNGWIDSVRLSDTVLHPEQFLRPTRFFSDARAQNKTRLGVMLDLTPTRVQTEVSLDWDLVGTLKPKSVDEIPGNFWSLGCETLDRDLADWDAYKGHLKPLGISRIRLQGGWNKTEKKKGVYDFDWLDHIVDSAHELGLTVCLETSYGNKLYEPTAGLGPGGVLPAGEETLAAWDAWVEAMVRHYEPKGVHEWMMYNEPNLRRENTVEKIVAFNARTAEIIKRIDPEAKIAGLVAAGLRTSLIEAWIKGLQDMGKLDLFQWVIYHGYGANPDSLAAGMVKTKEMVRQYSPTLKLWQGEAGCASEEVQYALSGIDWTEVSHAKWNARRMLCDFGHGIESSVFTISDISYHKDFISRYGLLKTAPDNSIIKVKTAYYVVNNIVSVFNGSVEISYDAKVEVSPSDGMAVYRFRDKQTGTDLISLWDSSSLPVHPCELSNVELKVENLNMPEPVWVDLLTGRIYRIPAGNISVDGNVTTLKNVPIFDSPVALADRSVLSYVKARESKKKAAKKAAKKAQKASAAIPLKSYLLAGAQKPAPAVIICCSDGLKADWAGRLAEKLQASEIHAFVLSDPSKEPADAVAYVRSQATNWQVDPKQIGIAGIGSVTDYKKLGASFAVAFGATGPNAGKDLHAIGAQALGRVPTDGAIWLANLLKWLNPRKTDVFQH
jgi:hypothetical protein